MHQYGTNQEFFAWTKGCGKMVIIFPQPFFMTYSDGKLPAPVSSRAEERTGMVVKTLGSNDTPSREISHRNATRTIRGGDFSTPLRFRRNDGAVSSRAEERAGMGQRLWALMKRRAQRSPANLRRVP